MMKKIVLLFNALFFYFSIANPVIAGLEFRGYATITNHPNNSEIGKQFKVIYDREQDITWFDYGFGGTPAQNSSFTSDLVVQYNGSLFDNWRMPITHDDRIINPDKNAPYGFSGPNSDGNYNYTQGHNMLINEFSYLYYVQLGNLGDWTLDGRRRAESEFYPKNYGPFSTIRLEPGWQYYISETRFIADPYWYWAFNPYWGSLVLFDPGSVTGGIAVMNGDIGAVPIPAAFWLLGSGLIGLVGLRKKLSK